MANASLQIGNGNWAIKEDNLLGYSKAGTRFLPIPITMTRATLGTRVNPSGLIENVELLGSELVTNGDFENNVIGWNKFKSNATESWNAGGYLDFTKTGNSGRLGSDVSLETNKTYKISVNVISLGGIVNLYVGLSDFETPYAGVSSTPLVVGTNTFYLTFAGSASSKGVYLQSAGTSYFGLTASIDSISVKEVTRDNLARVDYTDGTASLLVEPQRTNLVTTSEDFSGLPSQNIVTTIDSITSPSGIINADKATPSTLSGQHRYNPTYTVVNNTKYTASVFAKKNGYSKIRITENATTGGYADFDLLNGQVISSSNINSAKIEDYGNGWFRCIMVETSGSTSFRFDVNVLNDNGDTTFSGDGTSSVYLWGAQLEQGSYPTSYIKTTGSTVTRNQDQYSKTGISNLINSEEGVLFAEFYAESDSTEKWITLSDGTTTNRVIVYIPASNTLRIYVQNSSGGQADLGVSITLGQFNKVAFKYKENDFALWLNGVEVATDSSGGVPVGLDRLNFSAESGTYNYFNGKVKQLQVFKTALTDSELATLTT